MLTEFLDNQLVQIALKILFGFPDIYRGALAGQALTGITRKITA